MRISSRGTISMGPVGWLIVGPFLAAVWLAIVVAYSAGWLVVHAVAWCAGRLRRVA